MAHDVFISHSSNNRTVANAVCAALEGIGIRCWIAPRDAAEQLRQYFALVPTRAFVVGEVKVQPGPKPTVVTVIFDTRYSVRDALGTLSTGRTRTEWDLVRRPDGLKIARTNWMTYPDATPSR